MATPREEALPEALEVVAPHRRPAVATPRQEALPEPGRALNFDCPRLLWHPIIVLDGDAGTDVVKKTASPGAMVKLDASKTSDPDGNTLKFNWWVQADAGSYSGKVNISNAGTSSATVEVPADSAGKTFHVILEVVDDGTHNLSAYRRVVFESSMQAAP